MFTPTTFRSAARTSALFSRSFSATARASLARMSVIGRLTAEPELMHSSTGRDYLRYSVATNHGNAENKSTSFFRVTSFDDRTKDLVLSLPKGTLVHVDADARMNSFEDDSGSKRTKLDLVQRSVEVLSRPYPREEGAESQQAQR